MRTRGSGSIGSEAGSNASLISRRAALLLAGATVIALAADPAEAFFKRKDVNQPKTKAATVTEVLEDEREAAPMLTVESPYFMSRAIERYERIADSGGWPEIEASREFAKGGEGPAVVALKQRLAIEGYLLDEGQFDETYDGITERAVVRFQRNHGLQLTGKAGKPTIQELNVPVTARLATLRANLPRLEEYSRNLSQRYLTVNIPAAQLEAVSNGAVYSRHNIIAGKPDRPSPVVSAKISDLNFNPYWNAPASIVERDIIPALIKDPEHLRKLNIRVFDGVGGPEIDPTTVDWSHTAGDRYHFRQEPGEENAMASVKINFPSPFGVYMHDTPTKQLFDAGDRYFSSGCVRVDQIHVLVNWILRGQDGWDMQRIKEVADSAERLDVKVLDGPQVRWVYLTAWVTEDGSVNFRPDIYELDGTGFVVGQPLPVGQGNGSERWVTKPLPYGYDDQNSAALPVEIDGDLEQQHAKSSGPIKIIRKTNFNTRPAAPATKVVGDNAVPAVGKQDAN